MGAGAPPRGCAFVPFCQVAGVRGGAVVHARLGRAITLCGRAGVRVRVDLVSARRRNAFPGDLLHIPVDAFGPRPTRDARRGRPPRPPAAVVVVPGAAPPAPPPGPEAIAFLVPRGDRRLSVRCSVPGGATVACTP